MTGFKKETCAQSRINMPGRISGELAIALDLDGKSPPA
jgi:hypothetical protein